MRIAVLLLAFVAGCGASSDNGDAGPAIFCGAPPSTNFPVCNACVLCGPVMDSMGRRGCTDGTTHGCIDCAGTTWIMRTITGCDFPDATSYDSGVVTDAFVPADAFAGDAAADASTSIDAAATDTSDASTDDANADAN